MAAHRMDSVHQRHLIRKASALEPIFNLSGTPGNEQESSTMNKVHVTRQTNLRIYFTRHISLTGGGEDVRRPRQGVRPLAPRSLRRDGRAAGGGVGGDGQVSEKKLVLNIG